MGDGIKISKDKRHRSSSSLAALVIEGTRSERKLDIRASIPEVDDHFAMADARCDELQEKIDLVKSMKRKKKLKRRSMTRVADVSNEIENVTMMSVRTLPRKKASMLSNKTRRTEMSQNPVRNYVDPDKAEQLRMVQNMQGYSQMYTRRPLGEPVQPKSKRRSVEQHVRQPIYAQPDGDMRVSHPDHQRSSQKLSEVACGASEPVIDNTKLREYSKQKSNADDREFLVGPKNKGIKNYISKNDQLESTRAHVGTPPTYTAKLKRHVPKQQAVNLRNTQVENAKMARPEVELIFNKQNVSEDSKTHIQHEPRYSNKGSSKHKKDRTPDTFYIDDNVSTEPEIPREMKEYRRPRRLRYRSRRYELPTISSQMKQAGIRYYQGTANYTNIPFVASKSTAPSHNIGVNIQQVLNGMKIQQPLSGIPLTIAHHMGLRHIPVLRNSKDTASTEPSLDFREVNAIKVGNRLLRLPSYKYISYNRLLSLYREGEGMVPRFLRAINRPHYFYTSMYNLNINREDQDGATSKGCYSQATKQSLAEYASLYREYEKLEKSMKDGNCDPESEMRKNELSKALAARQEYIRRVVQDYRTFTEAEHGALRASASTAEDTYRHSTFKLNKF